MVQQSSSFQEWSFSIRVHFNKFPQEKAVEKRMLPIYAFEICVSHWNKYWVLLATKGNSYSEDEGIKNPHKYAFSFSTLDKESAFPTAVEKKTRRNGESQNYMSFGCYQREL